MDIWDHCKRNIKAFCIDYCKKKNKIKYNVVRELERRYFNLCNLERTNPGNYFEQIKVLKDEIKQFYVNDFRGSQIRSKALLLDNSEHCSKYFCEKEVRNGKKKFIKEIKSGDCTYTRSYDIVKQFEYYYKDMFTAEDIDVNVMDYFLNDLPVLDDFDQNVCEVPIEVDEIITALKGMENNKTQGPDGIGKEFYLKFIDIFGPILLKVYENIFDENTLSDSQKISFITLICKDSTKHNDVKSYRPISLMNVDVKILSKIICNRMSLVCGKIIGIDQTCAVRGRSILDNAHLHRNIVDYVNQKNLNCAFISLDQEKAFDRVSHTFLFNVLEKFNFGPNLIKWVKILYHDLKSCIIVNNFISDPINITRSVKQGCGLSPLLYILCLEPFVRKVVLDSDIVGINVPGINDKCKISVFADDSTGICTTDRGISKFLYLINLFGKGSGSKLNKNKTKGLWLGAWKGRKENYRFGIEFVDCLKIVGIKISNNLTQDDIWNPIYVKFEKVLNNWKHRRLSLLEKVMIVNTFACSKLWYVGTILNMSKFYINKFQRCIFKFIWNDKVEPLARNTMYLQKHSGGLGVVNIEYKLNALRLRHLSDIIEKRPVKFVNFSIYWVGFTLRFYNQSFTSLHFPHSELVSPFYNYCIKVYTEFKVDCADAELRGATTKYLYNVILDSKEHVPKIVEKNTDIEFKFIFKNVFDKFIDRFSRDVLFKIVHNILPTNSLLFNYNIYNSNRCTFCAREPETLQHLFFECSYVTNLLSLIKNWVFALSSGTVSLQFSHILLRDINANSNKLKSVILLLIGLYCKSVWLRRNVKKFERKHVLPNDIYVFFLQQLKLRILADYERLPFEKFESHWCMTDLFCSMQDDKLDVTFF